MDEMKWREKGCWHSMCVRDLKQQPATGTMDTLGFEPRAFRMRSGCDTTTPCAQYEFAAAFAKLARSLCSRPRRRNRRENAARPCNARRASDDNAELRASRDGAELVELHCGARESPLRASTRRSGAPGHAVTLRSSSGEDLWCSMLRCVFLRCLAFAVEAH